MIEPRMTSWPAAYREHAPGLRAFLRRRLGSRELAEDLCQDTFVRAMRAEGSLRDPSRLRAYLFQIARNLVSNHRRRPDLLINESDLGEGRELSALAPTTADGPDETLQVEQLRARVQRVLDSLPPDQRRAFEWGVLQRMPYAEIERRTGWSNSRVKINVFRARQRMIAALADDERPNAPRA